MNVIKLTNMEEVQSVYDWKELHKEEVRRGIIPVDEVKILVEIEPEPFTIKVSKNSDELAFRLFNKGQRFAKFTIKLVPGGYVVKDENIEFEGLDDDSMVGLLQDFVTLYLTLMALLVESPKQEAEEPSEAPKMKLQKVHNGKKGKKKQSYCYIVTKSRVKTHEGDEKKALCQVQRILSGARTFSPLQERQNNLD